MAQNDRYNRRNWEENDSNVGSSYDRNEHSYNRDRDYDDDRNRSYNRGNQGGYGSQNYGNDNYDQYRGSSNRSYGQQDHNRSNYGNQGSYGGYGYGSGYGQDSYSYGSGSGSYNRNYNRDEDSYYGSMNYGSTGNYRNRNYRGYDEQNPGSWNSQGSFGGSSYGRSNYGSDQGNYGSGSHGNRNYGGYGSRDYQYGNQGDQERGWWDRTRDEVASWFGDNDAQRRREQDHREDYRGHGPKNYRRTDDRIKEDINDRLSDDSWIDASDIEVEVSNGEVTLSGTVKNRQAKRRAEDLAEAISGVSNVENRLRVKQESSSNMYSSSSSTNGSGMSSGSTTSNSYSTSSMEGSTSKSK
jgi:osmotically-inducible protein OsmY